MATDPVFFTVPYQSQTQIATANTARDGTGTIGTLVDATSGGVNKDVRIDRIRMSATVTTTAGKIRWFWYDGTNTRYYTAFDVQAITVSASVEPWQIILNFFRGLIVKQGWKLMFSTNNAETFNLEAEGATAS